MIVMNVRQAKALAADVSDLPDDATFELHQIPDEPDFREQNRGAVELRVPDTEHQESGDYLFRDGSTGY